MLKIIMIIMVTIVFNLFSSNITIAQNNENSIQKQLYKMCQFTLGDTVDSLSQDNYLQKDPIQNESEKLTSYSAPFKVPEINGIPLYRDIRLSFYNNQLYNVFFEFNTDNPEIGNKLREYFTLKFGNPIVTSHSHSSVTLTNYVWKDGNYSIHLGLGADNGALIFIDSNLSKQANNLLSIEYAHMLKQYPENRKYIEELVKTDPEYKKSMKQQIDEIPGYKEALIDAGFDMTVFD